MNHNMNTIELEKIKQRVERLGLNYQIEILSLLVKGGVKVNENKTGIRLNLGFVYENHLLVFEEMVRYVEYAEEKENRLDSFEHEKQEISSTYFS